MNGLFWNGKTFTEWDGCHGSLPERCTLCQRCNTLVGFYDGNHKKDDCLESLRDQLHAMHKLIVAHTNNGAEHVI